MCVGSYCVICRSETSYLIQRILVGACPRDKWRVSTRARLSARYHHTMTLVRRYRLDYSILCSSRYTELLLLYVYSFQQDKRVLPVLWHQSLLTFVQRYKEDMSSEQKSALMELLRTHTHHQITAEVRREIVHSRCRGEEGNAGEEGEMQMEGDG